MLAADTITFSKLINSYILLSLGVAPDRQKVMIGGVVVQNDTWGKAESKVKQVSILVYMYSFPSPV